MVLIPPQKKRHDTTSGRQDSSCQKINNEVPACFSRNSPSHDYFDARCHHRFARSSRNFNYNRAV